MKHPHPLTLVAPAEGAPAAPATPVEKLWTVKEVAQWLSMTEMSVRAILKRRQFPAALLLKFGRRVRFRSELLRDWALRQQSA